MPYYIPLTKDGLLDVARASKTPKERKMPRKKTEADFVKDIEKALTGLVEKLAVFQKKFEALKTFYSTPAPAPAPAAPAPKKKTPARTAKKKSPKATAQAKK